MSYCPDGEISKNQLLYQCVAIISTHPQYGKLTPSETYDAIIKHTKEIYNNDDDICMTTFKETLEQ